MIHRREFEDKLREWLRLPPSILLSVVSNGVKVVCICKVKSIG